MGSGNAKGQIAVRSKGATDGDCTIIALNSAGGHHGKNSPSGSSRKQTGGGSNYHQNGNAGGTSTEVPEIALPRMPPVNCSKPDHARTMRDTTGSSLNRSGQESGSHSVSSPLGDNSPIPLTNTANHVGYIGLTDIIGSEASASKYVKVRSIGKGAYGEAYIVKRNPAYDVAAHPAVEAQIQSNALTNPTQSNGLYVAKIMDLRAMQLQNRQYAQTEIMCLAHTHHFAIIRYYEHYVLDSDDETVIILTEFADHGDLRRNLYSTSASPTAFLDMGSTSPSKSTAAATASNEEPSASRMLLSEREAGVYFVQLLLALHHIHARRMIHRDIKSANLLLTSRGFLKLGDFGFSQKYESTVSSETIAGTFLGTPYYLSPEMWKGKRYGKKADIWAAGVVLYEMLMGGRRPFEAGGLPELRSCVLEQEFIPPAAPPASVIAESRHGDGAVVPFSNDMRELLVAIFHKEPEKRPSAEELLHRPIMQHYLYTFEKHVQSLVSADAAKLSANPSLDRQQLFFPDPADQSLVLQGIAEGKQVIENEAKRTISESATPHYEGVVYKDNHNGVWKERYLMLEGSTLTISLSKGKEAVNGGERSKQVPLSSIKSVSPCEVEDAHVRVAASASNGFKPPYAFAIAMVSSNSIMFGVASAAELDMWMQTLMRALQID
jgi:serine/threonine protein kinase